MNTAKYPLLTLGCFMLLFVASLRSMYFSGIGASLDLMSLILFLSLLLLLPVIAFSRKFFARFFAVGYLLLIAWVAGMFTAFFSQLAPRYDTALAFLFVPLITFSFAACIFKLPINWRKVFSWLLWVHVVVFFLQLGLFYGLGYTFDPVNLLTGKISRNLSFFTFPVFGYTTVFRASGLFDEPGTYCSFVSTFAAFIFVLDGYKFTRISIISLLSIVLSFSFFGLLSTFVVITASFIRSSSRRASFYYTLIFFAIILYLGFFYIDIRFLGVQDSSLLVRLKSLESISSYLFGMGFVQPLTGTLDLGVSAYFYLYFGLFSLPLLFYFFCLFVQFSEYRLPIFMLLVSKISPTAPLFWILFSLLFVLNSTFVSSRQSPLLLANRSPT